MTSDTEIHMIITKTAKEVADSFDAEILSFFGSEEQVKAYAHLFVIEHQPLEISTTPAEEGNQIIYRAESRIRIRPKTLAELEAEKNV